MLFDTHAHLDDEKFAEDRDEVINRALNNGVGGILNAGACMASSERSIALAQQYPEIYAAVGIHPHDAAKARVSDYEQLASWASLPQVVAVGEMGLDYYYDLSPRDVQLEVFVRQIDVAKQTRLPIVIHDRDAHSDIMTVLKREARGVQGVLHCFSGSLEMAREAIKLGFYISVGGPVTFKNAAKLPEIVRQIPLEHLLVETDCPYLTPHPYRGKRNEPFYVKHVADQIAALRNIDVSLVAQVTTANAKRLFRL